MERIIKSPRSRGDYLEIWLYIARDNADAADRLVSSFDEKLNLLAKSPEMGKPEEDLAPSLRSFPVGNYLLYYRPILDGIELVRVLHGARDINPEMLE